jgi:hypothetical protein
MEGNEMSGGSFDYAYSRVTSFVYDLDDRLTDPEYLSFSPEVMIKLREIKDIAANTAELMRAVEWLYSGDDSEECFLRKVGDQQSEIVSLYEMNLAQAKTIKAYQDLCDQLGNALESHQAQTRPIHATQEAITAWREMKGGCDETSISP